MRPDLMLGHLDYTKRGVYRALTIVYCIYLEGTKTEWLIWLRTGWALKPETVEYTVERHYIS